MYHYNFIVQHAQLLIPSRYPNGLITAHPLSMPPFLQFDLPCMHSPSVQFLDWRTRPSQSLPPFLGAGAVHSLLRQWVHSVPQVDHLLHEVHLPSTTMKEKKHEVRRSSTQCGNEAQIKSDIAARVEGGIQVRSLAFTLASSEWFMLFLWEFHAFCSLQWVRGGILGHQELCKQDLTLPLYSLKGRLLDTILITRGFPF